MQAAARWLRTIFLAGLAVVVPVVLTAYLVWFVFSRLDALMAGVVAAVVGRPVPGGGVVASLALVLAVGVVATNFLGRRVIRAAEQFVERIPGIRTVYGAIKEIMHSVVRPQRGQFRRAVLVEFPPGLYMLGFVTQEAIPSRYRGAEPLAAVYVPTAPNPASGFLFFAPREHLIDLEVPVTEAFQAVISAGLIMPAKGGAGSPAGQEGAMPQPDADG
ncbi:DUF502 domain-containing protein [Limnochorda sp.]|uniref:DUF502 domain-containing protein n=1 Tax=Limnochorda sp. TaxID=1940279 RepID=UPI0039C223EB